MSSVVTRYATLNSAYSDLGTTTAVAAVVSSIEILEARVWFNALCIEFSFSPRLLRTYGLCGIPFTQKNMFLFSEWRFLLIATKLTDSTCRQINSC